MTTKLSQKKVEALRVEYVEWKQRLFNCMEATAMLRTVPKKNLKLDAYRQGNIPIKNQQPTCGSVACFGGWTPFWPHFAALQITAGISGEPVHSSASSPSSVAQMLFGDSSMFLARGHCAYDDYVNPDKSDLAVAKNRAKMHAAFCRQRMAEIVANLDAADKWNQKPLPAWPFKMPMQLQPDEAG